MANKFEGVTDDSITKPNDKRKQIQCICRWIMICGVCLMVGGRICSILIGVRSGHLDYVALVVVLVGLLVFFSGYYISEWHAKRLKASG